eukprot:353590-Chlamydomonas_euryale.AAC.7
MHAELAFNACAVLSAGGHMNELRSRQEDYARAGYLTAAVDSRYHGERAHPALPGPAARAVYEEALVKWVSRWLAFVPGCWWAAWSLQDTCTMSRAG